MLGRRLTYPIFRFCLNDPDNDTTTLGVIKSRERQLSLVLIQSPQTSASETSQGAKAVQALEQVTIFFHSKRSRRKIQKINQLLLKAVAPKSPKVQLQSDTDRNQPLWANDELPASNRRPVLFHWAAPSSPGTESDQDNSSNIREWRPGC